MIVDVLLRTLTADVPVRNHPTVFGNAGLQTRTLNRLNYLRCTPVVNRENERDKSSGKYPLTKSHAGALAPELQ